MRKSRPALRAYFLEKGLVNFNQLTSPFFDRLKGPAEAEPFLSTYARYSDWADRTA